MNKKKQLAKINLLIISLGKKMKNMINEFFFYFSASLQTQKLMKGK